MPEHLLCVGQYFLHQPQAPKVTLKSCMDINRYRSLTQINMFFFKPMAIGIWMWYSFVTYLATSVNIPIQETNTFHHVSTSDLQSGNVYEALRDPDVLLQVGELKKDL